MEETNIPDQLTYHEPEPKAQQAPQDPLYMASRIISAIFTPFMAPIVAFLILFFFSYLRILPLGYKLRGTAHGVLLYSTTPHDRNLSVT